MNYNLDGICQDCIYLEKIKPLFEEKDKEIERLNHECDTYMKIATKRGNIINELEKWLEEHSQLNFNCSDKIIHEQLALGIALDYLKELKGSENND